MGREAEEQVYPGLHIQICIRCKPIEYGVGAPRVCLMNHKMVRIVGCVHFWHIVC